MTANRNSTTAITGTETRDANIVPTNSFGSARRAQLGSGRAVRALLLGGMLFASPLSGTTAAAPLPEVAPVRYIGEWTSTAKVLASEDVRRVGEKTQNMPSDSGVTDKETVRWLHAESGLTWDQLGKVFGVSRRAVHMWANGGRLNATHSELLAEFAAVVRSLDAADPPGRRAALLQANADGKSIVDVLRARRNAHVIVAAEASWNPERLLGALHDRPAPRT